MIKANELRNMTVEEIQRKIEALKQSLFTMRTEVLGGRIEKPHRIRDAKRDIARCETIIREKSNAVTS
ncbi:MAG: 50S ribosomal protein L29 [Candidatus Omnitrophota bacterium]